MQAIFRPIRLLILPAALLLPTVARGQDAKASDNVLASHKIDRYEAIQQLQQALKVKPDNATDWVILGELAHEVALGLPADQDDAYYRISRDAYERALRLEPNNAALKAAVRFARDQETTAIRFGERRAEAAATYLEARRREMFQEEPDPVTPGYSAPFAGTPIPTPAGAVPSTPPPALPPGNVPGATPGSRYPAYPADNRPQGAPNAYQPYQSSYLPPVVQDPGLPAPMTLRQYTQQGPQVFMNSPVRGSVAAPRSR